MLRYGGCAGLHIKQGLFSLFSCACLHLLQLNYWSVLSRTILVVRCLLLLVILGTGRSNGFRFCGINSCKTGKATASTES